MAIISCPECSKDISDKALTCPHCGVSVKKNQDKKINNIALTVVLAIAASVLVYGFAATIWGKLFPKEDSVTIELKKSREEFEKNFSK
jgi:hypothetical protein